MKSALGILLGFCISGNVFAAQTRYCGTNMTQVQNIMRTKFEKTFKDTNYAMKFVGTWRGQATSFAIGRNQEFNSQAGAYTVCPQVNGSFYIYITNDPSQHAFFRLAGRTLRVYNGQGLLAMAVGDYVR